MLSESPPSESRLREHLKRAARPFARDGLSVPPIEGKLLRPAIAEALLPPTLRASADDVFWSGALAIQMVHEASLLHDDILDEADVRRGEPTVASRRGIGAALVLGDHYLTSSYRVAASCGSPEFLSAFLEAVERTVAGEMQQARASGTFIDPAAYESIIRGKSGALFGAAAALVATRAGSIVTVDVPSFVDFGTRLGALYQRVDDFLDYCTAVDLGKPALQDWRQRKTTFVLHMAGVEGFDLDEAELLARLFEGSPCVMERAVERLENDVRALVAEQRRLIPGSDDRLSVVLHGWVDLARRTLAAEIGEPDAPGARGGSVAPASVDPTVEAAVVAAARAIGGPAEWPAFFGRNSKTFRFASLLFPSERRASIEGVYAFCRFTDDLVDEAEVPVSEARLRLEAWRSLSRAAYDGDDTGIPLLSSVMGEMRRAEVPFTYADELLTGVGMDLEPIHYERMKDLEVYTFRVASVVGGWITELFGLRDEALLTRAFAMGHAMQLTNILRDVGEDWRNDRLYLPRGMMREYGVGPETVAALSRTGEVDDRWIGLMESIMAVADRHYDLAFEAIPALPRFYGRPVAVAARVYQGIQDEIRRNGYDNGTLRAHTSLRRKVVVGWRALRELERTASDGAALLIPQDV